MKCNYDNFIFALQKEDFINFPVLSIWTIDGYNNFQSNNKESKCYKSYNCIMGCAATFELGQPKISLPYSVFRTITSTFVLEECLFLQFYNDCDEVKFHEIVSINFQGIELVQ